MMVILYTPLNELTAGKFGTWWFRLMFLLVLEGTFSVSAVSFHFGAGVEKRLVKVELCSKSFQV